MDGQTPNHGRELILLLEDFKEKHFRVKLALFKKLKTYCERLTPYIKQGQAVALLKEQLANFEEVLHAESMNLEVLRLAVIKNQKPASHTLVNIIQLRDYENRVYYAVYILFGRFPGIKISFKERKRKKVILKILEKYSGISYKSYNQIKYIVKKIQEYFSYS